MKARDTEKKPVSGEKQPAPLRLSGPGPGGEAPPAGGAQYLHARALQTLSERDEDNVPEMEARLAVLDEYARQGYNTTRYDTWIRPTTPWPEPLPGEDYYAPELGLKVAHENLYQVMEQVWAGNAEGTVSGWLAGRIVDTVERLAGALREAGSVLPRAVRLRVQTPQDAAAGAQATVLAELADDILRLPGYGGEVTPARVQETTQDITRIMEQDGDLKGQLAVLAGRAAGATREEQVSELARTTKHLKRAASKSAHLREDIHRQGDTHVQQRLEPLMAALAAGEAALHEVRGMLQDVLPGKLANLNTARKQVSEHLQDMSARNALSKGWQQVRHGSTALVRMTGNRIKKMDAALMKKAAPLMSGSAGPDADSTAQLAALMVPLEEAASQLRYLTGPLPGVAEQLQRVMGRESRTSMAGENADHLVLLARAKQRLPSLSGDRKLREALDVALKMAQSPDATRERLKGKLQQTQDVFAEKIHDVMALIPYLYGLTGGDFWTRCFALASTTPVTNYLHEVLRQFMKLDDRLASFVARVSHTDWAGMTDSEAIEAVGTLGRAAQALMYKAEEVQSLLQTEMALQLGEKFRYGWREKNMAQDLARLVVQLGAGSPEAEARALQQLREQLSDPDRTVLHRPHDPDNRVLIAGMEQAYHRQQQGASHPLPTPADIVARQDTLTDMLHRKVTRKAVAGVAGLGVTAATGGGLPGVEALSLLPARRLASPGNALQGLSIYAGYKGLGDIKKATLPGQREAVYEKQKLINRTAGSMGMSVLMGAVPAPLLLPVTLPFALHTAATRPEAFTKAVTGAVPTTLAVSAVGGGIRGGMALHQALNTPQETRQARAADTAPAADARTGLSRRVRRSDDFGDARYDPMDTVSYSRGFSSDGMPSPESQPRQSAPASLIPPTGGIAPGNVSVANDINDLYRIAGKPDKETQLKNKIENMRAAVRDAEDNHDMNPGYTPAVGEKVSFDFSYTDSAPKIRDAMLRYIYKQHGINPHRATCDRIAAEPAAHGTGDPYEFMLVTPGDLLTNQVEALGNEKYGYAINTYTYHFPDDYPEGLKDALKAGDFWSKIKTEFKSRFSEPEKVNGQKQEIRVRSELAITLNNGMQMSHEEIDDQLRRAKPVLYRGRVVTGMFMIPDKVEPSKKGMIYSLYDSFAPVEVSYYTDAFLLLHKNKALGKAIEKGFTGKGSERENLLERKGNKLAPHRDPKFHPWETNDAGKLEDFMFEHIKEKLYDDLDSISVSDWEADLIKALEIVKWGASILSFVPPLSVSGGVIDGIASTIQSQISENKAVSDKYATEALWGLALEGIGFASADSGKTLRKIGTEGIRGIKQGVAYTLDKIKNIPDVTKKAITEQLVNFRNYVSNLKDGRVRFSEFINDKHMSYKHGGVIAEGTAAKIYDIGSGYLVKEYKRPLLASGAPQKSQAGAGISGTYAGSLSEANNNVTAFNRIYGNGSAALSITDGVNEYTKTVTVKMKRIPGEPLGDLARSGDANKQQAVLTLLDSVSKRNAVVEETLSKLKVQGINHYDINQANILFDAKTGKFNLIDFDRASINPEVSGTITPLTESQVQSMRTKLTADLEQFVRDTRSNMKTAVSPVPVQQSDAISPGAVGNSSATNGSRTSGGALPTLDRAQKVEGVDLSGVTMGNSGRYQGTYQKGEQYYIQQDGVTFQIFWDEGSQTWRLKHPAQAATSGYHMPVSYDADTNSWGA